MSTAWQKAGFSFNKYLAIGAKTVRNSLKEELRVKAEKRGITEVNAQIIKNGAVESNKLLTLEK